MIIFLLSPHDYRKKETLIFSLQSACSRVDWFSNLSGNDDDDCIHIPGDNGDNHDHHKIIDHESHSDRNILDALIISFIKTISIAIQGSYYPLYTSLNMLITSFLTNAFKLIISKMLGLLSCFKVLSGRNF